MILSTHTQTETYLNGNVSYIETTAIIAPLFAHRYPNHRVASDGTLWIRIGKNIKFNLDGSVQWELNYDEYGNLKKL